MSGKLVSEVFNLRDIPFAEKYTLTALASHANDDGASCFPGVQLLSEETGKSERSIQLHLATLTAWGFIRRITNHKGGRGHRDEYIIQLVKGEVSNKPLAPKRAKKPTIKGEVIAIKGEVIATKGEVIATKGEETDNGIEEGTVKEPSIEPSFSTLGVDLPEVELSKKARARKLFDPPRWWLPLMELDGYRNVKYVKDVNTVEQACDNNFILPAIVVNMFCDYWPTGRAKHGWVNPVKALVGSLDVQIGKAKRDQNDRDEINRPNPGQHQTAYRIEPGFLGYGGTPTDPLGEGRN